MQANLAQAAGGLTSSKTQPQTKGTEPPTQAYPALHCPPGPEPLDGIGPSFPVGDHGLVAQVILRRCDAKPPVGFGGFQGRGCHRQ